MADPRLRQITIKTGVVKRLAKEKISYEKEAAQQRKRIDRLKGEGADEHVLRKEEECYQESLMMVPDCQRRLVKAFTELDEYLKNELELNETKEYLAAFAVLSEAKEQMENSL